MEKSGNKKHIKLAILCLMMVIMAPTAISPIIANLIEAFPQTKVTTIQFLLTYPCILVIIASIIMGKVSAFISKKILACCGALLIAVMGIGAFFFHGSVAILYAWATVLGIGVGMVHPNAIALVPDYFEGAERSSLMGLLSSAGNMGGIIMAFAGGALAVYAWQANYLVYLLALLGSLPVCFSSRLKKRRILRCRNKASMPGEKKNCTNLCILILRSRLFLWCCSMCHRLIFPWLFRKAHWEGLTFRALCPAYFCSAASSSEFCSGVFHAF
jgi:MFS family permease